MQIAQIIGTVVATRKHECLVGSKIQVIQPLKPGSQEPEGEPFVAIDTVGAGVGEIVIIVRGSGARQAVDNEKMPIDAAIIGIIDQLDIEKIQ